MRILGVTAPVFAATCWLVVADDGTCVVVDPGAGVAPAVAGLVAEHDLRVVGVLATHGHADHVWDAAAVAGAAGVPLRLHAADAHRLADPWGTLGAAAGPDARAVAGALRAAVEGIGLDPRAPEPVSVEVFGAVGDGAAGSARTPDVDLALGGVHLVARHAPGHTGGSTLYLVEVGDEVMVLTGDVLFAGGVGRTDLPGGDAAVMATTLREVVGSLPSAARVLPGHGPASRVDVELATNPYLAG